MLNDRLGAAKDVATRLFALEVAIDEAIARAAEFTASMPEARNRANVSAVVGQDAIAKAGLALNTLIAARQQVVEAHDTLADVRDQMGLRTHMSGDAWKIKPSAVLTIVREKVA